MNYWLLKFCWLRHGLAGHLSKQMAASIHMLRSPQLRRCFHPVGMYHGWRSSVNPAVWDNPIPAITSPSGWWYTYPSKKWWTSSVGMMTFPTEWKNKNCSKPPTSHISLWTCTRYFLDAVCEKKNKQFPRKKGCQISQPPKKMDGLTDTSNSFTVYTTIIWRSLKVGLPLVIIHF